jgi:hypothetical protein
MILVGMKAKPLRKGEDGRMEACEAAQATHVLIKIPGPTGNVLLPVVTGNTSRINTGCWSWNGDTEKPTLKPSLRTEGLMPMSDREIERLKAGHQVSPQPFVCHIWVTNGEAYFLSDTTHSLVNETHPLLDAVWNG